MLLERAFEKRASVSIVNPMDPVIAKWFGILSNTAAGVPVTPQTAKRLAAVYTAVRIISESVASLPLNIYRRLPGGGREVAGDHPLYSVLHNAPTPQLTSFEWREMLTGHLTLRGNAYAEIIGTQNNAVSCLRPLHPDFMRVIRRPNGSLSYIYRPPDKPVTIYSPDDILHIRCFSEDGIKGESVIEHNKEAIGLAQAAEKFGATFFGNNTVVGGVLQSDKPLSEVAYKRLKDSWNERHQGPYNANKPAILEDGLKWQAIGVSPEQAQFLETRKFQISEIARMFRIPPHMLADLERATFSNIEQQSMEFVRDTLRPWLVRWEQRLNADLLSAKGRAAYFIEFDVSHLMRGDSAMRTAYYQAMFNMAAMCPNEIRDSEGLNPIEGGDQYYVMVNLASAQKTDPLAPDPDPADQRKRLMRLVDAQFPNLRQAIDKIVTAEVKALRRALNGASGNAYTFERSAADFYATHRPFVERQIRPVAATIAGTVAADAQGERKDMTLYVSSFVDTHMNESVSQVRDALLTEGLPGIERLLTLWECERTSDIVTREIKLASRYTAGEQHEHA
ncbi:MAG: phage portal protein [Gammaproteobacteria bacterium]